MTEEGMTEYPMLLTLGWEDVIFSSILPHLSLEDCFRLRATNSQVKEMVDAYFSQRKKIVIGYETGLKMPAIAFQIVTNNNVNLRLMDLSGSKFANDELVIKVLTANPKLETVDFSECHHLTDATLQCLAVNCKQVKRLVLRNCHWVSRSIMDYVSFHLNDLTTLNVTGCWELNDQVIIKALSSFMGLKFLSLCNIYSLTDNTLRSIASYLPDLIALDIKGCWRMSDRGLMYVGEYCRNLRVLHVAECRDITETVLFKLRERGVKIDRLPDPIYARQMRRGAGNRNEYAADHLVPPRLQV